MRLSATNMICLCVVAAKDSGNFHDIEEVLINLDENTIKDSLRSLRASNHLKVQSRGRGHKPTQYTATEKGYRAAIEFDKTIARLKQYEES